MPRHGRFWLGIVVTVGMASRQAMADPPAEIRTPEVKAADAPSLETTLALQKAMHMAKAYLRMDDAKKAVDVLEQNLARVNGHAGYLELLRDAYRAYIKDLGLKNQSASAAPFLQRLIILDPAAANDPTLRPAEAPKFVPPAPKDDTPPLPDFAAVHAKAPEAAPTATPTFDSSVSPVLAAVAPTPAPTPAAPAAYPKVEVTPSAAKPPVIRAIRELPGDDPFDGTHERVAPQRIAALDVNQSAALLAQGNDDFHHRRYAEARTCYERLAQADPKNLEKFRDRLAYCMLDDAVERINKGGKLPLAQVRKQVADAVSMSPPLRPTGDWLLKEIDQRDRTIVAGLAPDVPVDPPLAMEHFGKNPQGWLVTETTNFRIFHQQSRELVERVALIAERTRSKMAIKWFGAEPELWSPKCEIVLHATAADYARLTNVPATSPGHSRIETDPTTFRVIGRRIDLHTDTLGMLEAILPHETTHVVLAGNFGSHQVPRWADEGIAVLTEPLEKIEMHRRNLSRAQKDGLLMPIRDLMNLTNYPQAKQISAFYAQSVMLVEFLTQQRGPQVVTEFLRDGLQDGYEPALRKHYNWSFADLQSNWDRQVVAGRQNVAAGR